VARTIRTAINDDPERWAEAAHSPEFTEAWSVGDNEEDRLRRVPGDLDAEHPHVDDLRLKSFIAATRLTQRTVTSSGLDDELHGLFVKASSFTRFLCDAVTVPF
jgi:uncharacterized protein (DUF2461 family)